MGRLFNLPLLLTLAGPWEHGPPHAWKTVDASKSMPRKMIEGMGLRFVHSAARSKPPHFVVSVMKIIVLSVLTHTLVGTKLFIRHKACHMC